MIWTWFIGGLRIKWNHLTILKLFIRPVVWVTSRVKIGPLEFLRIKNIAQTARLERSVFTQSSTLNLRKIGVIFMAVIFEAERLRFLASGRKIELATFFFVRICLFVQFFDRLIGPFFLSFCSKILAVQKLHPSWHRTIRRLRQMCLQYRQWCHGQPNRSLKVQK